MSMDLSQQALQTNRKLISNFGQKQIFSKEWRGVNIDQISMCYIYHWIRLNELYKLMEIFFSN